MYSLNSVWHIGVQTVVDGVYYYWKTFKVPKTKSYLITICVTYFTIT